MKKMPYEEAEFIVCDLALESVVTNSDPLVDGGENGDLTESDWGDF